MSISKILAWVFGILALSAVVYIIVAEVKKRKAAAAIKAGTPAVKSSTPLVSSPSITFSEVSSMPKEDVSMARYAN